MQTESQIKAANVHKKRFKFLVVDLTRGIDNNKTENMREIFRTLEVTYADCPQAWCADRHTNFNEKDVRLPENFSACAGNTT